MNKAICNICGFSGNFLVNDMPACDWRKLYCGPLNLRESLSCAQCGSISRDRMLIYVLGRMLNECGPLCSWKGSKEIRILEGTGVRAHPQYLAEKFDYFNTTYDPEAIRRGIDSRRFADFQELHYADNAFDFVLASDIFEHIRLDDKAFWHVFRVLREGGSFLLQVPYVHEWQKTLIRVMPKGNEDIFLLPPEYHASRTLVYRIYGRDLLIRLRSLGFAVGYLEEQIPHHAISRQNIIICVKAPYMNLNHFAIGSVINSDVAFSRYP